MIIRPLDRAYSSRRYKGHKTLVSARHQYTLQRASLIQETAQAWQELQEKGLLQHGSGEFRYENFSIRL